MHFFVSDTISNLRISENWKILNLKYHAMQFLENIHCVISSNILSLIFFKVQQI